MRWVGMILLTCLISMSGTLFPAIAAATEAEPVHISPVDGGEIPLDLRGVPEPAGVAGETRMIVRRPIALSGKEHLKITFPDDTALFTTAGAQQAAPHLKFGDGTGPLSLEVEANQTVDVMVRVLGARPGSTYAGTAWIKVERPVGENDWGQADLMRLSITVRADGDAPTLEFPPTAACKNLGVPDGTLCVAAYLPDTKTVSGAFSVRTQGGMAGGLQFAAVGDAVPLQGGAMISAGDITVQSQAAQSGATAAGDAGTFLVQVKNIPAPGIYTTTLRLTGDASVLPREIPLRIQVWGKPALTADSLEPSLAYLPRPWGYIPWLRPGDLENAVITLTPTPGWPAGAKVSYGIVDRKVSGQKPLLPEQIALDCGEQCQPAETGLPTTLRLRLPAKPPGPGVYAGKVLIRSDALPTDLEVPVTLTTKYNALYGSGFIFLGFLVAGVASWVLGKSARLEERRTRTLKICTQRKIHDVPIVEDVLLAAEEKISRNDLYTADCLIDLVEDMVDHHQKIAEWRDELTKLKGSNSKKYNDLRDEVDSGYYRTYEELSARVDVALAPPIATSPQKSSMTNSGKAQTAATSVPPAASKRLTPPPVGGRELLSGGLFPGLSGFLSLVSRTDMNAAKRQRMNNQILSGMFKIGLFVLISLWQVNQGENRTMILGAEPFSQYTQLFVLGFVGDAARSQFQTWFQKLSPMTGEVAKS